MNGQIRTKRRWLRWTIVLVLLLLLAGAAVWMFFRAGQWLVVEDPLQPARAIVVLSGRMPERAMEAAAIYRQGYAPEAWVERPAGPGLELAHMSIDYVGEEFYNQRVLIQLGVPATAIRVLDRPIRNTRDEVEQIAQLLRQQDAGRVIVVTSKAHTRRVKAIWKRLVGGYPQLIVRYTREDPYDGAHWWRHTQDALDVLRELLGLANAWAGFPVQRAAH